MPHDAIVRQRGGFIPDVRFAIVIQRTNFDIQPAMSLKF